MKKILITTTLIMAALMMNLPIVLGSFHWLNPPSSVRAMQLGKDGDLTINAPNTIVNKYGRLLEDAPTGSTSIKVETPPGPHGLNPASLTTGDLLLLIQVGGALIDSTDTISYGSVIDYRNAGRHEFVTVSSVTGNVVNLATTCGGLKFSYTAAGKVQVIKVPQYTSLTINQGGSLTAPPWDGVIGGIVVVDVSTTTVINGEINVTGLGLRGGGLSTTSDGTLFRSDYRSTNVEFGGEKGESIAGFGAEYDALFSGRYARGAAANGGGGGDSHNAAGGGGANGQNGKVWTGQGVMDGSVLGAAAWALDPGYIANGNALTDSSGGGRGGYSIGIVNADALTQPPGDPVWDKDYRREVGGLGGRPVPQDTAERLFFGGGGGAGAQNNDSGGAGGNAGGIIYLKSVMVNGGGALRANGANGQDSRNEHRDSGGGAGAGGTIVVFSKNLTGISAQANGGVGGTHQQPQGIYRNESHGPGGGGGGGYIAYMGGAINAEALGGGNGVSNSLSVTEFPSNGATRGATGAISTVIPTIPICTPNTDISVTKTNNVTVLTPGQTTTYVITVRNNGPGDLTDVDVNDIPPPALNNITWTCKATTGSSCLAASGTGAIHTKVWLLSGGIATFELTGIVDLAATGRVVNTVTATLPPGVNDPTPGDNTATDDDPIVRSADLSIVKTASQNPIPAGGTLVYSLAVQNKGPEPAAAVTVTDPLAAGLTLISATSSKGSCTGTQTVTCNLGAMGVTAPDNQATITITVKVSETYTPGPLSNTATVTSTTPDSNPGDNSSTVVVTVKPPGNPQFSTANINANISSPDACFGAGKVITYDVRLTNRGNGDQPDNPGPEFTASFPGQITGLPGTCVTSAGSCTVSSTGVELNAVIPAGQTVSVSFQARVRQTANVGDRLCTDFKVNYDANSDQINESSATATRCITTNCAPTPCPGPGCPDIGPGTPLPAAPGVVGSDQRPGSILIFPYYTSDPINSVTQNTRINITNVDVNANAYVHLFFIDGSTCTTADSFVCLTPNQTTSFLLSDLDPGVSGYLIAVAVDSNGCPTQFNGLIGDEYVKLASGHRANLPAESVVGISAPVCSPGDTSATIQLDGVQYSMLGRTLAADNLQSPIDGNSTLLILDRIGGDLGAGTSSLGSLFGLVFNDTEIGYSFSFSNSGCQLRTELNGSFPRSVPRYTEIIPAGRTGWMKFSVIGGPTAGGGLVGSLINFNADPTGFNGGRNLHKLTLSPTSLTLPIFTPSCQ